MAPWRLWSDAVVLIYGWRYSAGTLGEIQPPREIGLPVIACLEDLPSATEFNGVKVPWRTYTGTDN
jgi:hypothetical protein